MMRTNVEILLRAIQEFGRRGIDGALQYVAEDVEVYDPDLPPGSYHGHEAVRRVTGQLMSGFRDLEILESRPLPAGDRVVWLTRTRRTGEHNDLQVEMRTAHTVTIRDGKIVYWRLYLDQGEALADAGLSPSLAAAESATDA